MKKKQIVKEVTKRMVALFLAAGMVFMAAGCGNGKDSGSSADRKDPAEIVAENQADVQQTGEGDLSEEETKAGKTGAEESGGESRKSTEYPVTISTYGSDGAEIVTTYEKAPERVLAVYQGSIETMLALGLEDRLVAAAGLDNEVPDEMKAAFSSVKYLDEFTPSLETVTMLEPDMILSWGSLFQEKTLGDAQDWIDKGTNVYINSNTRPSGEDGSYPRTLENEYQDILNLGIIFDVQDKAEAIVNEMKDTIAKTIEETAGIEDKPSVLILESYDSFWNYGADTLGGDMAVSLGATLAAPDAGELGKEDVVSLNPDVIFVVYMPYEGDDAETLKQEKLDVILKDEALASLSAVQNGRVVPIMLSEMYASATRTQDGIVTMAEGLYPDIDVEQE
jgi:iron complex transport system substrate-binding protein